MASLVAYCYSSLRSNMSNLMSLRSLAQEQDALDYFTDANGQRVTRNILPLKTEHVFKATIIGLPTYTLLYYSSAFFYKVEMQNELMRCIAKIVVNGLGVIVLTSTPLTMYRMLRNQLISIFYDDRYMQHAEV